LAGFGVAVCEPIGWHPKDFAVLKQRLAHSEWLHMVSSPTFCDNLEEVRGFVADYGLTSLAIVGPVVRAALAEAAKAAESAGVPRYAIQTLPFQLYHRRDDGLLGETWALASACLARKAASASFASRAVTASTRDSRVERRDLFSSLQRLGNEPVEDPVMVPERCSPFHRTCRFCSDACLYSAISHEGSTARIDPARCIHCGACAAVCPSGALQPPVFSDDEYRALLREFAFRSASFENPLVVFTSDLGISMLEAEARSGLGLLEGMVAVRSPTAAPLGWPHYLWAASAGVPVLSVCLAEEASKHPEAKGAEERAHAAYETLRGSYKTLVSYRTLGPTEKLSDICAESAQHAIRRLGVSFTPPGSRVDAVHGVPLSVVADTEVRLPGLNSFDVSVNEKCTLCGTCSNVCPVRAFTVATVGGEMELRFSPGQCTGCGICVAECPEGAMEVAKAFSPAWLDFKSRTVKARDPVELCRRCGKAVGSHSSLSKLHDHLVQQGSAALADSVYLCQECKVEGSSAAGA